MPQDALSQPCDDASDSSIILTQSCESALTDQRHNGWGTRLSEEGLVEIELRWGELHQIFRDWFSRHRSTCWVLELRQRASVAGCQLCSLQRLAGRRQLANLDQCQCPRGPLFNTSSTWQLRSPLRGVCHCAWHAWWFEFHGSVVMLSSATAPTVVLYCVMLLRRTPSEKHQGNARLSGKR